MDVDKLLETIKKVLRSQNRTYKSLAAELGISEPSVKRLFAQKTVSLERFSQICQILGVTALDLARMMETEGRFVEAQLSRAQEEFLCRDERIFVLFNLLRKGWSVPEILRRFSFDEIQVTRMLVQLDKEKLIELHAGNKVRLRVQTQVDWLPDGPVRKMYEAQIKDDFFAYPFEEREDRLRFLTCEVSSPTLRVILKKLDRLAAEVSELVAADEQVGKRQTKSVAFLMGARPWVLPALLRYKKGS